MFYFIFGVTWCSLYDGSNYGYVVVVIFLLERGADINKGYEKEGETWFPIYEASKNGHVEVVKCLLERGVCFSWRL